MTGQIDGWMEGQTDVKSEIVISISEKVVHEGAFYQLFVQLSSATSFEPIFGNIDVLLG